MCDPLTIGMVTAGVGALSSVAGFIGQQQAYKANVESANVGYMAKMNDLNTQAVQIDRQQSENTASAVIARAKAAGAISASASSFGIGPQSAAAAENASDVAINRDLAIRNINSESQRLQNASERTGAALSRQSQIAQVPKANPLSLALGLAGSALGGVDEFSKLGGRFPGSGG